MSSETKPKKPRTKKEKLQHEIDKAQYGVEHMGEILLGLTTKSLPLIDEMTTSSLKRILKLMICYPMKPEHFQSLKLLHNTKLSLHEKELHAIGTSSKDVYADIISFYKNIELFQDQLDALAKKEKKDE